ncbi:MAG: D-tagatose-bisphosphate aldolase, class II, non-catalytic subunit [Ancalomicrobiaceae bacterium]|nr:D-tagatose-bisphosphate aldolase, class II, non-catalytic subunit [Ancalomicrobiaceae bacterium]
MLTALAATRRLGAPLGIPSICTAHETVLAATLARAKRTSVPVLIEATCNQVNQFGGYTGLPPADFVALVRRLAASEGLDETRIILGGDHLGPNPWKKLAADEAMDRASAMVDAYVRAGFAKIHLDASMGCAGEPAALDDATTAGRAARLAAVAERAAHEAGLAAPVYVIGTEVPVPGGADHVLDRVAPTTAAAARQTISVHRDVFHGQRLEAAFDRVIALVVQPGVEFGNANVVAYRPEDARDLSHVLDGEPSFVFEAHSTDYQTSAALKALVRDGYQILKVGPAVTFALREALYGLSYIAGEISADYPASALQAEMDRLMLAEPGDWQGHYHGDARSLHVLRHYSYSDRIRYYWQRPEAVAAVARMMAALGAAPLPATLVSQFLPQAQPFAKSLCAADLIVAAVDRVLADYAEACRP